MPLITHSTYKRPNRLFNGHVETVVPALIRSVKNGRAVRHVRINTPDDDFLDLDWHFNESKKAIIISHGLEGDSQRPYVLGMARCFYERGWNVIAWNFRGCSGEMNRSLKFYHSGSSYDLQTVVNHVAFEGMDEIAVLGFSLGGNITLKYLGEGKVPEQVKAGVAISTPIDMVGCSLEMRKPKNYFYSKRFLDSLKLKVKQKAPLMPEVLQYGDLSKANTIFKFDDMFTSKVGGFENAMDYYEKCSSVNFVPNIKIPTLVVNALNDSFLSESCYDPTNFAASANVYLEIPKFGGHVGFSDYQNNGTYWSEMRAYQFISEIVK